MAEHGMEFTRRDFVKGASVITGGIIVFGAEACANNSNTTTPPPVTTTQPPMSFTQNLAGEPVTIDPNQASWASDISCVKQLFSGVLGFNADLSLRADLATQIPTVANSGISADGKTYTFTIKSGTLWSDGQTVKAGDFVYSIKRFLDPTLACEYASFYWNIAGAQDYNTSTATDTATLTTLAGKVGVSAPNDTTLVVKLASAQPTFLQLMALWPVYPVRQDIITKYGNNWTEAANIVGNGPFKLKEWVHQDHMTFVPNPNFWGTKPQLTTLTYKMITDANAALAAFKNNELDISGVPVGTEKATIADATLSPMIVRYNDLTTYAFQFNVKSPPFDNVLVRKGLSCAVDRSAFINQVKGGVGKVALSWIPPGMPGYDATIGTDLTFNVTQAKLFLSQAGYPDPSKLTNLRFQYANTASNSTIAQFLQGQLQTNLGINLTLEPMESKAFSTMVNANQETWAFFGWGADYPDPDDWLPQLFGTGAGNNHTSYSNPAFDALSNKALVELDNTTRLSEWNQAQKLVMADAPILTMFYRERFFLVHPWVKNFTYTGMDGQLPGDFFFNQVTITQH